MSTPRRVGLVLVGASVLLAAPSMAQDPTSGSADSQSSQPLSVCDDGAAGVRAEGEAEADSDCGVAAAGEVIVVDGFAPRTPTTAASRLVTGETLAATPHRAAEDILAVVPGLYMSQHGSEGKAKQFFLRGFDAVHGADLEVSVAGIALNELSNVHGQGYVDLGFVIAETVCSLRADKGSFALDQGSFATAGSVAFELCVPSSRRGYQVGYELGTSNRHRLLALLAPASLPESSFLAVEAMHDEGFGSRRQSQRLGTLGQLRLASWQGGWAELLATAYAADFEEPGLVPLADFERGSLGFYQSYIVGAGESRRLLSGARAHHERGDHILDLALHGQWRRLQLIENFTGFLLYPETGDRRLQAHRMVGVGVDGRWQWRLTPRLSVVGAGEAAGEWLSQHEDQLDQNGVAWQANRSLSAAHRIAGVRLGARVQPLPGVELGAGLRVDMIDIAATERIVDERGRRTMTALSPRLTGSWSGDGLGLFLAYGHGLRPPEARAVVAGVDDGENQDTSAYQGGSAHLTTSRAAELGARIGRRHGIAAGLSLFGVDIANEMVFDHVSGVTVELNSTRRLGAEVDVEYRPRSWLELRVDLSAVDARFVASGNPVPNAPPVLVRLHGGVRRGRWRAHANLVYLAPRPLAHGATAAASAVVDVTAAYRWRDLELGLQVDNALASEWHEGEYHYASWFDTSQARSQLPRIHFAAGRPFAVRLALTNRFR